MKNMLIILLAVLTLASTVGDRIYVNGGGGGPLPVVEELLPPLSPTDLQLALFAHMAFFPFNFNRQIGPGVFKPSHFDPFNRYVIARGGTNRYGFNFMDEMEGWYLVGVHTDRDTGFRVITYACANRDTVVLSLRGTYDYDALAISLLMQSGTWWCNFRSIAGHTHSHVGSLDNFLDMPATRNMLADANIYITGHSLGGYLAYIATVRLVEMGLEENIRRVAAFSAPIFTAETVELIQALHPDTRRKITHFYVPGDLIAGFVGVPQGTAPNQGAFELTSQLLQNMRDIRGIDVSPALITMSNLMSSAENRLPFNMPAHVTELIWQLDGAMSAEALEITNRFRRLVPHVAVPQTWHSHRADPAWANASLLYILRNHSTEWALELMIDMIERVFDTDAHFMMNFYSYLP